MSKLFNRKKTKPEQEKKELPKPEFPLGTRKIIKYWDDTTADYMYKMAIYNRRGLFDDVWYEWTPSEYLYNKDKQWAIRNAEHYGVKIENE